MSGDAARTLDPEFPHLAPDVVEGYRNAPAHLVAEVVDGELSLLPRPRRRHAQSAIALGSDLHNPFSRGRDGPGGWIILPEPELHLGPQPDILIPDLAGWRRERLPPGFLTDDSVGITLAPDWVCEVLSPSTEKVDRGRKLDLYHREAVSHVWLLSPPLRTIEVYRRNDLGWLRVATFGGDVLARVEPFDAVVIDLGGVRGVESLPDRRQVGRVEGSERQCDRQLVALADVAHVHRADETEPVARLAAALQFLYPFFD